MLDRIRRKLFLSIKVMSSQSRNSDGSEEQTTALKANELMSILRKGSNALSRENGDGLSLSRFLDAPIDEILHASKSKDDLRSLKIQKDMGEDVQVDNQKLLLEAEEEEKRLLSGIAQVQSRLFEGKVVTRVKPGTNKDIAAEWDNLQKRARQTRIVVVDGFEVLAEHLGPAAVSADHMHVEMPNSDLCHSRRAVISGNRRSNRRRGHTNGRTGVCIVATAEN